MIDRIEPAVDAVIAHVEDNVAGFSEPVADVQPAVSLEDLARMADDGLGHGNGNGDHGSEGSGHSGDGG